MENPGCPPRIELPQAGIDAGLAVKDGVREVRFNLRRGARRLAEGAHAVTHPDDRASVPGPLALLGEPLDFAVRTTARLLRTVDRAAVDLLSSDGPYRALEVPLRSSASYFEGHAEAGVLLLFTHDHYWRYRHWLAMRGRDDVFVREQAIERAGLQLFSGGMAGAQAASAEDDRFKRLAQAILALSTADILVPAARPANETKEAAAELAWQAAACAVLAGEISLLLPDFSPKVQTTRALQLASEIMDSTHEAWAQDLAVGAPVAGLARWLSFALRHV